MSEMRVECYAVYRADQRPIRFTLREHSFEIIEVQDQWYSPGAVYFRVRRMVITSCFGMTKGRMSGAWTPFAPRANAERFRRLRRSVWADARRPCVSHFRCGRYFNEEADRICVLSEHERP